jgi:hypothetical protein
MSRLLCHLSPKAVFPVLAFAVLNFLGLGVQWCYGEWSQMNNSMWAWVAH